MFKTLYPKAYTASVSTRVSNALLVGKYTPLDVAIAWPQLDLGAIIGQLFVGVVCDRMGRKVALVFTTLLIVLGATLGTTAHGAHGSAKGLFWFLTFARGITGIVRADAIVWSFVLILSPGCRRRVSRIVYQCQRGGKRANVEQTWPWYTPWLDYLSFE